MTKCCANCRAIARLLCDRCVADGVRICETCERPRDDIDERESTSCGECQEGQRAEEAGIVARSGD